MKAIWQEVWQSVHEDFSDLPHVKAVTQLVLRMLLAIVLGDLLGYQRERQGKAAGLRTHMLVTLGATLFVFIPLQAGMALADLSRVLQGLLAGLGFLVAGISAAFIGVSRMAGNKHYLSEASMLRIRYSAWNGPHRANESATGPGSAGCATVFNY